MILFQQDCIKEVVKVKISKILYPFLFICALFFMCFLTIFIFISNFIFNNTNMSPREIYKRENGKISLEDIQSD